MENVNVSLKRKISKPLIEKRRRERINKSLDRLKTLVLRATNQEENVKMEKADVLEMALRYITDHQHSKSKKDTDTAHLAMTSYIQGYTKCVNQVVASPLIANDVRASLSNNLASHFNTTSTGIQNHSYQSPSPYPSPVATTGTQGTSASPDYSYDMDCSPSYYTIQSSPVFNNDSTHSNTSVFDWSRSSDFTQSNTSYDWSRSSLSPVTYSSAPSPASSDSSTDSDCSAVWRPW